MNTYALAFVCAVVCSLVLTPLARELAIRKKWLDDPRRSNRTIHRQIIPRTGGLAIILSFFAPLTGLFFLQSGVGKSFLADQEKVIGLFAGGLGIAVVGLLDDLAGLGARRKFLLQILIALFAYFLGFRIDQISIPFEGALNMGIFGILITVGWIVGVVNALNLIDGLDGLAGGIAFFACLANFCVGLIHSNVIICLLSAAMAGALLGFLRYNFNPATIFMGDTGSMFLGYLLAVSSIWANMKANTVVSLFIPLVALGLPIMDTLFAMFRRWYRGMPIFAPDRGHLHHRLLDRGIHHAKAALILYGFSVAFMLIAIIISFGNNLHTGIALVALAVLGIVLLNLMGGAHLKNIWKRRRVPAFCRHSELLRVYVFKFCQALERAPDTATLKSVLLELIQAGELVSIQLRKKDGIIIWSLENPHHDAALKKTTVSVDYPVAVHDHPVFEVSSIVHGREQSLHTADELLRFSWCSELNVVSPQADILLQLLVDVLSRQFHRLASGPVVPATSVAPA